MSLAPSAAVSSLILLAAFATIFEPHQQQSAPTSRPQPAAQLSAIPTLHLESRLVSLALNVVDQNGAPITGLRSSDFELTEDDRPQRIAIFEPESTKSLEIVLAIDASESVFIDSRLERSAACSFMRSLLRQKDRIALVSFSDTVRDPVPFTNSQKKIAAGLDHLRRGDATALYDAVSFAGLQLARTPSGAAARRVIVLITDGENTTRHGSYSSAIEQAERAGAMIYPLILVPIPADAGRDTGGEHTLIQMAEDTGGTYLYVPDEQALAPALAHVSSDLRSQYNLGYYAPQHSAKSGDDPSGLRHIHLQLKDPALRARFTLHYRSAYYADR